jgi:cysteine desulfurase / selenocysteine lyase
MFDVDVVRRDFPIFKQNVNGNPVVYLDSGASSQRPLVVTEAVAAYYNEYNANVHRGIYQFSERASEEYERARKKLGRFVNAQSWREVIFTRNATESINLVAFSWGRKNIGAGDTIIATEMEHHANLVPWQILAREKGARLEFIPVDGRGRLDMAAYERMLEQSVKLVTFTLMSNVLGTITPAREIIARAHAVGAITLVDGAQSVPHLQTDVQFIDCDFLAFSGHKMLGPTGVGVLWGRKELLEEIPPFITGGDMIKQVSLRDAQWNDLPWKFEAGTPAIGQAIGLGYAVDYLNKLGMENVRQHEIELVDYALNRLGSLEGIQIYGPMDPEERGGAITFNLGDIHPHDLATLLDQESIAIRAGHHCAMPLHDKLGLTATARASFYIYNKPGEVDQLAEALDRARQIFEG